MAFRIRRKPNVSVMRVGIKVGTTVIMLYAAGLLLNIIGEIMNSTASPFYAGTKLIGWTVTDDTCGTVSKCTPVNATSGLCTGTQIGAAGTIHGCITDISGSGILAIIGLLALIWIVFEFVQIQY